MEAEICIQGKFQNYSLKISNSDGYKSHYNKKNFWRKKEMGELIENWNTKYGDPLHQRAQIKVLKPH